MSKKSRTINQWQPHPVILQVTHGIAKINHPMVQVNVGLKLTANTIANLIAKISLLIVLPAKIIANIVCQ